MTKRGELHRFRIGEKIYELIGPIGAITCAVVCLGLPVVSGLLGIAGMNFLRDDRLLIAFEVLCCGTFLWTFERGRHIHGRLITTWLALAAAGMLLVSMFLPSNVSRVSVVLACIALAAATVINRVLLKRCSCAVTPANSDLP